MGTRGLLAFHVDGQTKASYMHWGAHPGDVGLTVLQYLRGTPLDEMTAQVRALRVVSNDVPPTQEQAAALAQYADRSVGVPGELGWYQLLRATQGNPAITLEAGYIEDSFDFGQDSLFCEWAFVVDLDAGNLDAYEGFNTAVEPVGLWAGLPTADKREEYKPITRVASFPLSDLPSNQDFLKIGAKDNG